MVGRPWRSGARRAMRTSRTSEKRSWASPGSPAREPSKRRTSRSTISSPTHESPSPSRHTTGKRGVTEAAAGASGMHPGSRRREPQTSGNLRTRPQAGDAQVRPDEDLELAHLEPAPELVEGAGDEPLVHRADDLRVLLGERVERAAAHADLAALRFRVETLLGEQLHHLARGVV